MVHLDVHVRLPEGDGVARSVYFPPSDSLGEEVRQQVFATFPEATDYSFTEVSSREVVRREKHAAALELARKTVQYFMIQTRLEKEGL